MAKGGGARKYVRDNRGRFAAVGATARGGRLKTASGGRRATQTRKIQGRPGNTISKPRGLQPGSIKAKPARRTPATSRLRPGELMNANGRPVNTMARFRKGENPFVRGGPASADDRSARLANVKVAVNLVKSKGVQAVAYSGNQKAQARARGTRQVEVNRSSRGWQNPAATAIQERRSGFWASSAPKAVVYHEMGHIRDKNASKRTTRFGESWSLATRETDMNRQLERGRDMSRLARRVSRYATYSPSEFIAETYAGLKTGRRYDSQVMRAYREAQGLSPRPAARRRSRLPKRSKS